MCGQDRLLHPDTPNARSGRRRSADIGGLSLAMRSKAHGHGWLGHSGELQTRFAELLSDMYTQTLNAVNEYSGGSPTTAITADTRTRLIADLACWNFEPRMLPDEDHVVACAVLLFEALFRVEGIQEAVGVQMAQIPPFIQHLRHIYRWQNSYHNFEHALDVLQATYSYLRAADMVPPLDILLDGDRMWSPSSSPSRNNNDKHLLAALTPPDLLTLFLAAIGHDVGHPGFTNLFMNNAATPLSVVFDGKSALEQMHCALLLRVMRAHGLGGVLDDVRLVNASGGDATTLGAENRKLLWETVLATDMSVHDAFMRRFEELIEAERGSSHSQTTGAQGREATDNANSNSRMYRRITICQAIIKCADISNPSRPYYISQHWATALMREWNSQALLEQHHRLPPTVEAIGGDMKVCFRLISFYVVGFFPLWFVVGGWEGGRRRRGSPSPPSPVVACYVVSLWDGWTDGTGSALGNPVRIFYVVAPFFCGISVGAVMRWGRTCR
ncbi:hypothetical protein C8R43DRAFT_88344 [Mycena crocata]|nr:hypothetical protein C8R43DRAFT_88344 [Mycena crocata]